MKVPPERVETDLIGRIRRGMRLPRRLPEIVPSHLPGLCEVTFAWQPDDPAYREGEVMVHLNSITDAHREDIGPARMEWIGDTGVAAVGYLLPDDLVASYRIVWMPEIPQHAGATREGWRAVHEAGEPDPRNPERIPNPLGTTSSVLRMPRSQHNAAELVDTPPRRDYRSRDLELRATSPAAWARLLVPEKDAQRLLVLFDGEAWDGLPIEEALRRLDGPATAAVLVGSGPRPDRVDLLPDVGRVSRALEDVLAACRDAGLRDITARERVIVCGQSLGGLAAASCVVSAPHLVRTAIAQSGSYWHGSPEGTPRSEGGAIMKQVEQMSLTGRRLVIQYGNQEQVLGPLSRRFAEACRAASADVIEREYPGGHDYAWWLTGLLDGLDRLAELPPLAGDG